LATLDQLLSGTLTGPQTDDLRRHLSECPRCRTALDQLSEPSPLREFRSDCGDLTAAAVEQPELGRLLKGLSETPPIVSAMTTRDGAQPAEANAFLGPPEREGDLGTLGSFRVVSELGRGGMGIVFRAYDKELARTVALKVLRWERSDERARARFVQEAQAAARLEHENVVAVHGVVNPPNGPPYLVMQYVAGQTLRQEIEAQKQIDPREAARLAVQIADGLAAAHRAGLVHRDIKPANIMLDAASRQARIMDFGLVRVQEESRGMTQEGTTPGTPEYMSPEQIREPEQIDERSDLYSLGVTLYEVLTGEVPFRGTPTMVLQQVLHDEPVSPRRLCDRIPRDLETICLKAMAKEPARRYQTASDLRDDLTRWLGGETIRARPAGRLEQTWRWCRRRPREATLIAAIALLLLVLSAGAWLSAWRLGVERNVAVENLRDSYLSQAQARRWSGQAGRRFKSLEVLSKAAEIRPGLDLGNEAVACMPLVDLQVAWQRPELVWCAFDSDLARYARAEPQGAITIRRSSDGAELLRLPGSGGTIGFLYFSPDDRLVAAVSRVSGPGYIIHIWDVEQGKVRLKLQTVGGIKEVGHVAFSPDSRLLTTNFGDEWVRIYDLTSGTEVHQFSSGGQGPVNAAFHPTKAQLAVHRAWDSNLQILDANSGQVLTTFQHPISIGVFAWRPDGRYLAVACGDHSVRVWDATTEKLHKVLEGHQNQVTGCTFSHSGDLLATCGWDVTTRLWDPVSGRQLVSMPGYSLHFSHDDRHLGYTFADMKPEIGTWEVATGRECRLLHAHDEQGSGPWSVDIHSQGRLMATASDDGVRLWDLNLAQEIAHLPLGWSRAALFHPSGDSLITAGKAGVQRWPLVLDMQGGMLRIGPPRSLGGPASTHHNRASLSRDGRRLAVVMSPDEAVVIDVERPDVKVQLRNHPNLDKVIISPDGRWAATGTQHGTGVKVWDATSGKLLKDIPVANYGWAVFGPEGRTLIAGSAKDSAQTWEIGSWNAIPSAKQSGEGIFSPDGKFFAALADLRRTIRLLDVSSGKELATLTAPNPLPISAICISPDGTQLAATCNFHVVQLWDLRAIRTQLAGISLDWNLPSLRMKTNDQDRPHPLRVEVVSTAE